MFLKLGRSRSEPWKRVGGPMPKRWLKDAVGIALVVFHADAGGRFFGIQLKKSSGDKVLDEAAVRAVRAASGKVKRPKELGTHDITIFEEVRFQYGLK